MPAKVAKRASAKAKPKYSSKQMMFQMKIRLADAPVPIWRRVVIKGDTPLNVVHEIFQIVMGWWNTHLHDFEANGKRYADFNVLEPADAKKYEDESKFCLADLVSGRGDGFVYNYDYGDFWIHHIVVESIVAAEGDGFVTCICGKRACPPEDVGGTQGYAQFLDAVEDPYSEQGEELLHWAGTGFDAESFDIRGVNLRLLLLQESLLEA